MNGPRSWREVEVCTCRYCRDLLATRNRCRELEGFRVVHDFRMFNRGFGVADIRKLFAGQGAATLAIGFESVEEAAQYVMERQEFCDAFISTYPHPEEGKRTLGWRREVIA